MIPFLLRIEFVNQVYISNFRYQNNFHDFWTPHPVVYKTKINLLSFERQVFSIQINDSIFANNTLEKGIFSFIYSIINI